ncbi:hypothetical protein [Streptacidiphilus monticola]|uniref:Uncharacterized protein n=1 Tax=Streptacidiphilus monticola TaxID=2161674 RepID=A0ABW1FUP6_9ACTN
MQRRSRPPPPGPPDRVAERLRVPQPHSASQPERHLLDDTAAGVVSAGVEPAGVQLSGGVLSARVELSAGVVTAGVQLSSGVEPAGLEPPGVQFAA